MGFTQELGRFFSGQPVFNESDTQQSTQSQNTTESKYIPQAIVTRTECDEDGANMRVNVTIKNNSNVEVLLDKIRLINISKELGATLRAGEEKEYYAVFYGLRPTHTSYSECQLEYRTTDGDYFRTSHYVEYSFEPDKTYSVRRITYQPPVRDI